MGEVATGGGREQRKNKSTGLSAFKENVKETTVLNFGKGHIIVKTRADPSNTTQRRCVLNKKSGVLPGI